MTPTQKFFYNTFANVIFLMHLSLVLIVCIGWLFPSIFYLFLTLLVGTALSEVFLGYCILTKWEFGLRRKINSTKQFDTSCIFHYGRALFGLAPRVPQNKMEGGVFKKIFITFSLAHSFGWGYFYALFLVFFTKLSGRSSIDYGGSQGILPESTSSF